MALASPMIVAAGSEEGSEIHTQEELTELANSQQDAEMGEIMSHLSRQTCKEGGKY